MKRLLLAAAALAVLATSAFPAAALNPQPLPPKIFKNSDLLKRQMIVKKKHYLAH
jgi:opacity protein-like surface antigen